jgi:hypothetical protein
MISPADQTRLYSLFSRLCDGDINAQDLRELDGLLDRNPDSIAEYREYVSLHLDMANRFRTASTRRPAKPTLSNAAVEQPLASGRRAMWRVVSLVVAASLALVVTRLIDSVRPGVTYEARIEQLVDCDWDAARWGKPQSANLDAGREIAFSYGLMKLEFGKGASISLEGPVRFTILDANRGKLSLGKLTASVPHSDQGFTIDMPAQEVVDLGTKFGISVEADGSSETHVFEGRVLFRGDLSQPKPSEWTLSTGDAMHYAAVTKQYRRLGSKPGLFAGGIASSDQAAVSADRPLRIPANSQLVLWLDAGKRLRFDERSRIVSWGNLCSRGDEDEDNGAWQLDSARRPGWAAHQIAGQAAVRFDGNSYLVSSPIATSNDVTLICVFRTSPAGRHPEQLLNLNGPSAPLLGLASSDRVFGMVTASPQDSNSAAAGRLEAVLPSEASPAVAAYAYSHSQNHSTLSVNGAIISAAAPAAVASNSSKFVGASSSIGDYFNGDLAEVLLFNSALTAEQVSQISEDLASKYGITNVEKEPRVLSHLNPDDK